MKRRGSITVALAGDTMLGRERRGGRSSRAPPSALFAPEVVAAVREADLVVLNLECCISDARRAAGRIPRKPFFFRAPPAAVDVLVLASASTA